MTKRFNPAHLARLESEERRKILPPEPLLSELGIGGSDDVVDVGVGPGFFALPAAQMTQGTIYGVDIAPEMLARLSERAQSLGLQNVVPVASPADRIDLPDSCADRALCGFMLHEVEDLPQTAREIFRVLRPGGRFLVLEWAKKETAEGPPLDHRLHPEEIADALSAENFRVQRVWDVSQVHYALLAERP